MAVLNARTCAAHKAAAERCSVSDGARGEVARTARTAAKTTMRQKRDIERERERERDDMTRSVTCNC